MASASLKHAQRPMPATPPSRRRFLSWLVLLVPFAVAAVWFGLAVWLNRAVERAKGAVPVTMTEVRYIDGNIALLGDTIELDHGERTGSVVAVIDTPAQFAEWGLAEPGIMVESDFYGLLFVPEDQIGDIGCRLISRRAEQ